MQPDDFDRYIPVALRLEPDGTMVDWWPIGTRRFVEPFFDQTIQQHRQEVRGAMRTTSADALLDAPLAEPRGFLFHASRCGSTLVTQMLASVARNTVLSEPAVVHQVITADDADLLRSVIRALCRPESACFVKFSSAAISKVPLVRRAFPDVRCAFLYRDPLEILGAYLRTATDRLPPGIATAGLLQGDPAELAELRPAEFWSRVLAERFANALRYYEPGKTLLLNYAELPHAIWGRMSQFFGYECSADDVDAMRAAASRNAKAPSRPFEPDSERKRDSVPDESLKTVERKINPLYVKLEALRSAGF